MKKIIAAAAGLMLAGSMAVTATAAEMDRPQLTIKGDARVRMHLQRDFINNKTGADIETNDYLSSRIRVTSKYKAKGGAYAIFRVRIADAKWDGGNQSLNYTESTNFRVDKAWIGVPVGPVTIEGGLTTRSTTSITSFDGRRDRLSFTYKNDGTNLKGFYDKNEEYFADTTDDEDMNTYGLELHQAVGKDWKIAAVAAYQDDETPADASGFIGSISGFGKVAGLGIEAEFMYVEEVGVAWGDTTSGADDDAMGGQLSLSGKAGDVALKGTFGFTEDGFKADQDFGYLMIGSYSPIVNISNIGNFGDTLFGGLTAGFKISDKTKVTGNLVYLDIDEAGSALEISGQIDYAVSEGARLSAGLGMVDLSADHGSDPDTAIGAFGEMAISF